MCLAVPGRIVKISKDIATIDYEIERRKAKIVDAKHKVGDYVIVQGGIVIQKVPAREARNALKLYRRATELTPSRTRAV